MLMQDVLNAVGHVIGATEKHFEDSMAFHTQSDEKKVQIKEVTHITRSFMIKLKAEFIGQVGQEKVEDMSIERVLELMQLKMQIELEQRRDVKELRDTLNSMPSPQKEQLEAQIEQSKQFMGPMLVDFIWWRTAGKVEWEDVDEEVSKVIDRELKAGNNTFQQLIAQFQAQMRPLL